MKKTLLFILAFLPAFFTAKAQYITPGAHSFSFGVSGLSRIDVMPLTSMRQGSVLFRKYLTETKAIRYALGLGVNFSGYQYTSSNGISNFSNTKSIDINLNLGWQWGFKQAQAIANGRLFPYFGIDVQLGSTYTESDNTNNYVEEGSNSGLKPGDYNRVISTNIIPVRVGAIPFVGCQYFLTHNFALGVEIFDGLSAGFSQKQHNTYENVQNGIKASNESGVSHISGFSLQSITGGMLMGTVMF